MIIHTLMDQSHSNHKLVRHLISIPLDIYQLRRHELFRTLSKIGKKVTQNLTIARMGYTSFS